MLLSTLCKMQLARNNALQMALVALFVFVFLYAFIIYEQRSALTETSVANIDDYMTSEEEEKVLDQHDHYVAAAQYQNINSFIVDDHTIVGFWHVGPSAHDAKDSLQVRVRRQWAELKRLAFFQQVDGWALNIVFGTHVTLNLDKLFQDDEYKEEVQIVRPSLSMAANEEYFEFPTLHKLHTFCQTQNDDRIVFYIHSKTALKDRQKYQKAIFSDKCVECLQNNPSKQICGQEYKWAPDYLWSHVKGNFWFAKCGHIKKLNSPFFEELLDEARAANEWRKANDPKNTNIPNGWPHDVRPYGRFYAEYWLINGGGELVPHDVSVFERGTKSKVGLVGEQDVCVLEPKK